MTTFDTLSAVVATAPTLDARLEALLHGLADRIKSTSNDQNVQKLSRELRAAAPRLAQAVQTTQAAA